MDQKERCKTCEHKWEFRWRRGSNESARNKSVTKIKKTFDRFKSRLNETSDRSIKNCQKRNTKRGRKKKLEKREQNSTFKSHMSMKNHNKIRKLGKHDKEHLPDAHDGQHSKPNTSKTPEVWARGKWQQPQPFSISSADHLANAMKGHKEMRQKWW